MKVLIADKLPSSSVQALEALGLSTSLRPELTADELPSVIAGVHVLVVRSTRVTAATFEAAGALIAGGDVVKTISKNIISVESFDNELTFIWAMLSALLAASLWIHIATYVRAPVSTTHSIVGGVMGAGIGAAGFTIVNWGTMSKIAASWVISLNFHIRVAELNLYHIALIISHINFILFYIAACRII